MHGLNEARRASLKGNIIAISVRLSTAAVRWNERSLEKCCENTRGSARAVSFVGWAESTTSRADVVARHVVGDASSGHRLSTNCLPRRRISAPMRTFSAAIRSRKCSSWALTNLRHRATRTSQNTSSVVARRSVRTPHPRSARTACGIEFAFLALMGRRREPCAAKKS